MPPLFLVWSLPLALSAVGADPVVQPPGALGSTSGKTAESPANDDETPGARAVEVVARTDWDPAFRELAAKGRHLRQPGITYYPRSVELTEIVNALVVHHSDFTDAPGPATILAYHLEVSGFSDIGYHFVIAADGTVYEGRPLQAMGAHAGQSKEANRAVVRARKAGRSALAGRKLDPDWGSIGIVLDGYFDRHLPSQAQLHALEHLLDELRRRFALGPDRIFTHREVRSQLVEKRGLTFTGPTKHCPGDALHSWVADHRRARAKSTTASSVSASPPGKHPRAPTHSPRAVSE